MTNQELITLASTVLVPIIVAVLNNRHGNGKGTKKA
jgi:hypothetical protein